MTDSNEFEVAMPGGSAAALTFEGRDVPAGTRARVTDTLGDGKIGAWVGVVRDDFVNGWPWRAAPPALKDVSAGAGVDAGAVPDGNTVLRLAWTGWNYAVAIPATALLYTIAWLLQHPVRGATTGALTTLIVLFSIYG